jgi:predicted MFS family arabinose efflux permease
MGRSTDQGLGRNFRLLFAGRAISYVGTYLAPIAVAFAVLDLGGGATAVGLSFAAWTLAQVAMLAVGGVVAEVWMLIALQAAGGASVAFYNPAFYGLVREIVPTDRLQRANSLLAIARYAAFPLGAAVGGTIVALVGSGTALVLDGATYAASALLLSFVRVDSIAKATSSMLRELRDGWAAFVEQQWVWVLTSWIALYFVLTYAPFFVLGPYIAEHSMHGAGSWAPVVAGAGIGALLGSLAGLRVHFRQPLVAVGRIFLLTALQSVLLAFHAPVWLLAPAAACAGFGFACGSVVWDTQLQKAIAPDKLARVAAYGWMSAMVMLPAGYALAGPISALVGMRGYLLFGATWLVVSTAVVYRLPSVRAVREPAPELPAAVPS